MMDGCSRIGGIVAIHRRVLQQRAGLYSSKMEGAGMGGCADVVDVP